MTRFDHNFFTKYFELYFLERLFLRTCCYFPPKPRRAIDQENHKNKKDYYKNKLRVSFGFKIWPVIRGKTVLDLGCGQGDYEVAISEENAKLVIGLDIQNRFLRTAREVKKRGYNNIGFIQGSLDALKDKTFDVLISHDSFEHFSEPELMFTNMVRKVKTGGDILIKFGPPWRNPWGRHMSGTIRKDRPWVHLFVPEKIIMRCYSVYHNDSRLLERYEQRPGGLNKMTVARFKKILKKCEDIKVVAFDIYPVFNLCLFINVPIIREFFASDIIAHCKKL